MALTENQKIFELQSALENHQCFNLQYKLFDSEYNVDDQNRTFKKFAGECLRHWNGLDDKGTGATSSSHGYANLQKAQKNDDRDAEAIA